MTAATAAPDTKLPLIDMRALMTRENAGARRHVAEAIAAACRQHGFFYVTGHGVAPEVLERLEQASRRFFARPESEKLQIAMTRGGAAWRGFFPVGGELTSGRPDLKEGIYFGTELAPDHPRVTAGWPLHGPNLWPPQVPELRPAVEAYMSAATRAAHALMEGISLSLGLDEDYFARTYTAEPTVLFRIFHYPARPPAQSEGDFAQSWGAGEHTDYGLLTLLAQDENGALEVRTPAGWIAAPPVEGALVCNIGDMLEKLTGGVYRSTPHRVLNRSGRDRLSFPLFFDPDFAAEMTPLPAHARPLEGGDAGGAGQRWDGQNLFDFEGTYGDYLMGKVAKVFPELGAQHLRTAGGQGR
ncbi:MAG: 2-oxoglutarate and iron-dependent oxygenase domain-containing protein [Rhodovibrionaceae bacterium]|nr:2-oxoglutarate and iron-dependent oxygenase domain-containing protein [Rhodovibrionaceae bacterium]